jgi:hypothetical protein
MTQAELIDRFLKGEDSGKASNLEIRQLGESRIGLIGYETMLYAEYDENDEEITIYTDWQKTVPKVKKHIRTITSQAGSVEIDHQTESGTPLVEA